MSFVFNHVRTKFCRYSPSGKTSDRARKTNLLFGNGREVIQRDSSSISSFASLTLSSEDDAKSARFFPFFDHRKSAFLTRLAPSLPHASSSPPKSPFLRRKLAVSSPVRTATSLARLSPQSVTDILRRNEATVREGLGPALGRYDYNQLESNNPVEDRAAEGRCVHTSANLFAVIDGHAGPACAQAISERLFQYIGLCLIPTSSLEEFVFECLAQPDDVVPLLVDWLGGPDDHHTRYFQEMLAQTYASSLKKFAEDLLREAEDDDENKKAKGQRSSRKIEIESALVKAFHRLDQDLSREALEAAAAANGDCNFDADAIWNAFSGAVASVLHVDGIHLHVASCGDVQAVLGSLDEDGVTWSAKSLTSLHNCENEREMARLLARHPKEQNTVVKNERLLGQLVPLRAFGDVRFKWESKDISRIFDSLVGYTVTPQHYLTPPYLDATPEVAYHRLTPRDRFLVIASDGLWDVMSPQQVVNVVGAWKRGMHCLKPFEIPRGRRVTIAEIHKRLQARSEGRKAKIMDDNAATHLIRHALGGTESGVDHRRLSSMLALPQEISRLYRDDITITVIHFNVDYLRNHPAQ